MTAKKKKVTLTDRMQRGYVYWRTEPVGIFGDKYMTDCREEFPRNWFARARLCAEGMTRGQKTR